MLDVDELQKRKDLLVDEKNQILRKKWKTSDEINQLQQNKFSYQRKGDFLAINDANIKEKKLKNELYRLKKQIEVINEKLTNLDKLINDKEIEKINEDYILNQNLSENDIGKLIIKSKNISEKFDFVINEFSLFSKTIDAHLKKIGSNFLWEDDLNLLKDELQTEIQDLQKYRKQTNEFKQLDELILVIDESDENLKNMKSNFDASKNISLRFESTIKEYAKFLSKVNVNLKNIPEKFSDDDFKLIRAKIRYNTLFLLKNKKYCYNFKKINVLNDILDSSVSDLEEMKTVFDKSNKILIKFHSVIEDFTRFLIKIEADILEFSHDYFCDDLREMGNQIKTQKKYLLNTFRKNFDFNILDELSEELVDKRKYLVNMKIKLNDSRNLLIDFETLIKEYSIFLNKIDKDLLEIDEINLAEELKMFINEVKINKENLINYQKQCFKFSCFDELNKFIDVSNENLKNFEYNFDQRKIGLYDELLVKAKSTINEKLNFYSKLHSKLSSIIYNTKKFDDLIDNEELLNNLKEINVNLSHEFKNLTEIKKNLESSKAQITHKDILWLNYLINMLNRLNFEDFEKSINEQLKIYENLSFKNEKISNSDVRKVLDNFEKCYNKPMFKHQLKRYNLKKKELDVVKNGIITDIINQVIVDENTDFKKIIKKRCSEFKKGRMEFDDNKLDYILDINEFSEFDDEIIRECKHLVKMDLLNGNISINNVKLKFKKYLNKKVDENNQLEELNKIKNNPNVPNIKIHLSQQETNEIYEIVKKEIISEYGIRGSVENRVYYWCNQRIRENQSNARGRLNIIKREFSNLTQLNLEEQNEFLIKIEFLINENRIKPYDITEEKIMGLSEDFINNKL